MPKQKKFDKRTATTFTLVHRAQNDPLANDDSVPQMVFAEKQTPRRPTDDDYKYSSAGSVISGSSSYRSLRTKHRGDLEEEFGLNVRPNEGEAAEHGVFFDDTQYDYMQHMRELGGGQGNATWVEASTPDSVAAAKKGKGRMKLEDALRDMDLGGGAAQSVGGDSLASSARSLLPEEILPSEFVRKRTYQDQQDVPDEIAGFQPDMDPRLREVLEALEDEEYVDDEEDIFGQLTQDGYEVERDEWERLGEQQMFDDGEDHAGWESDDTIKASTSPPTKISLSDLPSQPPEDVHAEPVADPTEGAWIDEFKKFKSSTKVSKPTDQDALEIVPSTLQSSALSSLASSHRKKRKGAKTSTTNYSMTSSALARTDQQTLLDARFDKIEESYLEDEMADDELNETMSAASGMTGMSKASHASRYSNMSGLSGVSGISSYSRASDAEAPHLERSDFNSVMDEFLGNYSTTGKAGKRVKKGGPQSGMQQLDEIRGQLGPARLKGVSKAK